MDESPRKLRERVWFLAVLLGISLIAAVLVVLTLPMRAVLPHAHRHLLSMPIWLRQPVLLSITLIGSGDAILLEAPSAVVTAWRGQF
jgi:hypothetical protein